MVALDKVLHLATHATYAPQHGRAPAHAAVHHGDRPALIWTRTDQGDMLASNGLPGWHDHHGQPHRVPADTWQRTTTGRRGSTTGPAEGWLPLTRTDRRGPALIDRHGHTRGAHWFVLDTGPEATARIQLSDHRDEIVPAGAAWRPAVVTGAAVADHPYPALIADGYSIDGTDVMARFDRATVEAMIADLDALHADTNWNTDAMPGEYPVLRLHRTGIVTLLEEHDDGTAIQLIEADRITPDPDGYYSIGAYHWRWTTSS